MTDGVVTYSLWGVLVWYCAVQGASQHKLGQLSWRLIYMEALGSAGSIDPNPERVIKYTTGRQGTQSSNSEMETVADYPGANFHAANLRDAIMVGSNLQGADLSEADLTSADLSFADLSGADLHSARLVGANLKTAEMTLANLEGADLSNTDMSGADLYGANLSNSQLKGALLYGADLWDADLSGAKLDGALYDAETRWPESIGTTPQGAHLTVESDKSLAHKRRF